MFLTIENKTAGFGNTFVFHNYNYIIQCQKMMVEGLKIIIQVKIIYLFILMTISNLINSMNTSKYFAGIMILLLNLGSKFLALN